MEDNLRLLIKEIKKHFPNTFKTLKPLPKHAVRMSSKEETNVSDENKLESIRLVTKILGCRVEFSDFIQDFKSGENAIFKGWEVCFENSKYIFIQSQKDEVLMFSKTIAGEIKFCSVIGMNGSSFSYTLSSVVRRIELELI